MTKADIILLIQNDNWMMAILRTVKTLDLPDWYVGAGFIRSKVWDTLHGYSQRTSLPDVDVIYFEKNDFTPDEANGESTTAEISYEKRLQNLFTGVRWSVTNQARMHLFHHTTPYNSSEEALSEWVETATCIGVRLDQNDQLILSAPRGIDDLVNLILRPISNSPEKLATFNQRVKNKKWLEKWPKLKVII